MAAPNGTVGLRDDQSNVVPRREQRLNVGTAKLCFKIKVKFHLRELVRKSKLALRTVQLEMERLVKAGLVTRDGMVIGFITGPIGTARFTLICGAWY